MTRKGLRTIAVITALIAALFLTSSSATAITAGPHYTQIEEVPIQRLLQNIERTRKGPGARGYDYWLAFARIHLLAYIRQTTTLPAADGGSLKKEVLHEGPFVGCTPIARPSRKPGTTDADAKPIAKCHTEDTQYGFPAPRGLPAGTLAVRHPPDDHLRKARSGYVRVRAMNPQRVRPRLALAYIYDRFGEMDKAIAQLRFILDHADVMLPQFEKRSPINGEHYWDYQIVAAEAIEHLSIISKSAGDRARIAKLRPKLKAPKKIQLYITPILVPLTTAPTIDSFVDASARVRFDLTGQGLPLQGGWITKDAAWLVWDPGNKQKITSGFQLFGSVTWLTPWENGYVALGALDDNGDGKIADNELKGLSLWRDANSNGVSEKGEVKPVADWNIISLGYRHKRRGKDAWISEAGVTFANGETRPTYDWNIRTRLVVAAGK